MQFLALFHDPLAIRKCHCRHAPYSAYCALVQSRAFVKKISSDKGKKASNPISIISSDIFFPPTSSILTQNFKSSLSEIKLKAQPVTNRSRVTDWALYLNLFLFQINFLTFWLTYECRAALKKKTQSLVISFCRCKIQWRRKTSM